MKRNQIQVNALQSNNFFTHNKEKATQKRFRFCFEKAKEEKHTKQAHISKFTDKSLFLDPNNKIKVENGMWLGKRCSRV